jgi:acyl-[acyl-carrier-protein]-phospholipid O-acyltransferase/long-chain-fatty-acid--[acyl-carrier-protein] ligase
MMPGMTVRILNPDTRSEQAAGEAGLVVFKGDNIFSGYLKDAEKTTAAFHDGWFVTGDLGRFDEDGFLVIEGRLSRFSKIGGEMVPHGTIEARIVEAFGLDETDGYAAVVMGVPDAAKGEQLVLLATRDELTAEAVREKLSGLGLPNLWIPKLVHRVVRIPVLGTGKLDLKAAKEMALAAANGGAGSGWKV